MSVERRLIDAPEREGNPDFLPSPVTRAGKDRERIRAPCRSLPLPSSESKRTDPRIIRIADESDY